MAFNKAKALQAAEKSVSQGKISQAIKQYQTIFESDRSDLSLLNTVGDLYIRERNLTEGLRQFHKLAEAYVHEGFNVKAIAIYRKISKVDPNSVDALLKLAELYQLQGLSREAREQYLQAVEFLKRRNQAERALDVLRKLVQLDPENLNFRNRLAGECEQIGKREDAAQSYLESAEILLRRGDHAATELALKKAAELDPKNAKIWALRAQVAIALHDPQGAETIINSMPELQSDPAVKRILLEAYLATGKLPEAKKLVGEVFHANPADFTPVSGVSALLVEKGDIDQAYELLASVTEPLINQNNAGALVEALRKIWKKAPSHIPTLELIRQVCEHTANESTLSEVLEALGRAHEEAGDLEKAEAVYLKLVDRDPINEHFRKLLNGVQKELGKEIRPEEFSAQAIALTMEEEPSLAPVQIDVEQEAVVKEALENSDLFARYNLPEKAISELEKALEVYPDQIELHRRILEISRKGLPERAVKAAAELARIFTALGDVETADKYHAIAAAQGSVPEIPLPPPPASKKGEAPEPPPQAASESPEVGMGKEPPIPASAREEGVAASESPQPPGGAVFELTPPNVPSEPPFSTQPPGLAGETMELDLTGDLEAMAALGFETPASVPETVTPPAIEISAPVETQPSANVPGSSEELTTSPIVEEAAPPTEPPAEVPQLPPPSGEEASAADLEDSRIEVEFYLENGFEEEARQTLAELEEKYPGHPLVEQLRQQLVRQITGAPAAEPSVDVGPREGAGDAEPQAEVERVDEEPAQEPGIEIVQVKPQVGPPPEPVLLEEDLGREEWQPPTSHAVSPQPEVENQAEVSPSVGTPEPAPPALGREPATEAPGAKSGGETILGELAGDLAKSLKETALRGDTAREPLAPSSMASSFTSIDPGQGVAQLSGLLAEMEDSDEAGAAQDDPETHYNLGVAFREMGLLDEAIGEFQKVVKNAGRGNFPPNFLPACSLLAICFMEKKMPAIAVKWYIRALETPGLDEEAQMALQYDLGLAYEQAGESQKALGRFTEVYSQNIDFRDVADKIRDLQQKA